MASVRTRFPIPLTATRSCLENLPHCGPDGHPPGRDAGRLQPESTAARTASAGAHRRTALRLRPRCEPLHRHGACPARSGRSLPRRRQDHAAQGRRRPDRPRGRHPGRDRRRRLPARARRRATTGGRRRLAGEAGRFGPQAPCRAEERRLGERLRRGARPHGRPDNRGGCGGRGAQARARAQQTQIHGTAGFAQRRRHRGPLRGRPGRRRGPAGRVDRSRRRARDRGGRARGPSRRLPPGQVQGDSGKRAGRVVRRVAARTGAAGCRADAHLPGAAEAHLRASPAARRHGDPRRGTRDGRHAPGHRPDSGNHPGRWQAGRVGGAPPGRCHRHGGTRAGDRAQLPQRRGVARPARAPASWW